MCVLVLLTTEYVDDVVRRGGRCLLPVFALGRAQELLLILGKVDAVDASNVKIAHACPACVSEDYWRRHPELASVPIYYASSMVCSDQEVVFLFLLLRWSFMFLCAPRLRNA